MKHIVFKIFTLIFFSFQIFFYLYPKVSYATELWLHKAQEMFEENLEKNQISSDWEGFEIDIFYSKESNKFFITHDPPSNSMPYRNLKSLMNIRNQRIWFDIKNYNDLDLRSIKILKSTLKTLAKNNDIFVEGFNPIKLILLNSSEYNIIFNLSSIAHNKIFLKFTKLLTKLLKINNYSISANQYELIKGFFQEDSLMVFTINNSESLCNFLKIYKPKVILTKINSSKLKCIE